MKELRCPSKLLAQVTEQGLIELPCDSRWCGKQPGLVILHRFNAETGELVQTLKFKAPPTPTMKGQGPKR